jgi:hypothetical protein
LRRTHTLHQQVEFVRLVGAQTIEIYRRAKTLPRTGLESG